MALLRDAGERRPLLWLLLGADPPVKVRGLGRMDPQAAIMLHLEAVLSRAEGHDLEFASAAARIPEVLAWTTWARLGQAVAESRDAFTADDPSTEGTVRRLAESVSSSINRHA